MENQLQPDLNTKEKIKTPVFLKVMGEFTLGFGIPIFLIGGLTLLWIFTVGRMATKPVDVWFFLAPVALVIVGVLNVVAGRSMVKRKKFLNVLVFQALVLILAVIFTQKDPSFLYVYLYILSQSIANLVATYTYKNRFT